MRTATTEDDDDSDRQAQRRSGVDLTGALHANALDAVHGRGEADTAPTVEGDDDIEQGPSDPVAGYGVLPAD